MNHTFFAGPVLELSVMLRRAWMLPLCFSLAACGGAGKESSEPPGDPFRDERQAPSGETESEPQGGPAPDTDYSEGAVPEDEFESSDSSSEEEIEIEVEESEDDFDTDSELDAPE